MPRQRVQAGEVDTRVIGKPDQFDGDPMKGKDIKGKDKAKDVRNESSKKVKSDDWRKCFFCNKTGHVTTDCSDIHTTQQRSCRYRACSQVRHTPTFVIAMPCVNNKKSCEFSSE